MEGMLNGILIVLISSNVLCLVTTKSTHGVLPAGCLEVESRMDTLIDCSSRELYHVPRLPKNATVVNLSNNNIGSIFDSPFEGMSMLRELDLSDNPLASIQLKLFKGLSNLRKLSLKNSLLYRQKDLVLDTLLSDLLDLNYFSLTFQHSKFGLFAMPCASGGVNSLQHVDTLEIDSAFLQRPSNSSQLVYSTKSVHIINGFNCNYDILGKKQIEYMPLLENLSISMQFMISRISDDIVKSQTHLKHHAIYGPCSRNKKAKDLIHNVSSSVSGLHNLTTLILNNFSYRIQSKVSCPQIIYKLTNLVHLTSLSLAGNSLSLLPLAYGACEIPVSLKHLNLQNNCLSLCNIYEDILFFNTHIEILDAADQSNCPFIMGSGKSANGKNHNKNATKTISSGRLKYNDQSDCPFVMGSGKSANVKNHYKNATKTISSGRLKYNGNMLQTLIYTHSSHAIFFPYNNDYYPHLRYFDLSFNNKGPRNEIPNMFSFRRPNLQVLKMSCCNIYQIGDYSFSYFNKLVYLDLSQNMLGSMQKRLSSSLANLTSLKELNISSNKIQQIPSRFFNSMSNIEKIDLSGNELNNFELGLLVKKLSYLNLSDNRLEKFSQNTRNKLDILANRHSVKVDLSGNKLLCTCETLDFLQWIKDTKVHLLRKDEYECSYGNGTRASLRNIGHVIKHLRSDCASKTIFIVTMSSVTAFGLLCICAILTYKFRWKIRYLYYKTTIKIPYRRTGHGYEQLFEFDVFVSYSTEDHKVARQGTILELETKRNLRACIHERDFMVGETIAYNISKGIRSSKRTILFLSSNFLASEWCMYELNIARMESLHTRRKVILVVLLEDIPYKSLPIDVLDIIDTYTYLEYPKHRTRGDLDVFWSKCADFIS